jgi:serine/threonine protein kinase
MLSSGSRIAQYEIVSRLGSGGMGEVYHARDVRLGRDVAIKVMAPHLAADPEMRRRFETEARAVASLSHPGILSIYEMALVDDLPCAVMELLQGENLRERLRRGPLPWRDAAATAAAIADGLAAAHQRGIIHRDLKPENVFLTADGHVKILDFGLAVQRLESPASDSNEPTVARTAAGVVLGTFGYMSPEQVRGEAVDGRSDVFAVGCLIYEMVTGRRLFGGATPSEVVAGVLRGGTDLSGFDVAAPRELSQIVARTIDRNPERRFDASDLAIALRSLATSSVSAVRPASRARSKSLAVLPFVNIGADPQLEYLTDGITETIINSLSQLEKIRVVPRSLAFRYKGLQADPATVGLTLNARTILTGRVTQHGDELNIQAELVDTTNESQLWGDRFRVRIADLLAVQEQIAWQISEALRLRLTSDQKRKLRKRHTVSPEAYEEYLRGRHHWNQWTPESFRRALEHFGRAIEIDPRYALAYAGLGDTYGAMSYYGYIAPQEGFPKARAAAVRAIELDPEIADAHVSLGLERLFWGWDWPAAEAEFKQAIRRNPKLSLAHAFYGLFLVTAGRFQEAADEARLAKKLDPLSPLGVMCLAWVHHFAGNHAEAEREALLARDVASAFEEAGNVVISSYEHQGRFEDAARLIAGQRAWGMRLDGRALAEAYRSGGKEGFWRKRLEMLQQVESGSPTSIAFGLAIIQTQLGDHEKAIDELERMERAHLGSIAFVGVDPCLVALRGHPRYEALLKRVGSPMASAPHTVSQ